jgi:RNA polymerase sigma factor (sigma-70 family)
VGASPDGPNAHLDLTLELRALLGARDHSGHELAWSGFVERYSRLLFQCARSLGGDRDAVMDRYAHILEELARDDCRRLRAFRSDGTARFNTWLAVVARRLCFDHHRLRYGRSAAPGAEVERVARRSLADSLHASLDVERIPDERPGSAEQRLERLDLGQALAAAVATLPARDRLLLTMRFEEDLPVPRISALLEFPTPFHCYRHLNRILHKLRESLRARGIETSDG